MEFQVIIVEYNTIVKQLAAIPRVKPFGRGNRFMCRPGILHVDGIKSLKLSYTHCKHSSPLRSFDTATELSASDPQRRKKVKSGDLIPSVVSERSGSMPTAGILHSNCFARCLPDEHFASPLPDKINTDQGTGLRLWSCGRKTFD